MESARVVITVSDLIQRNSPLSGAFSLSSPSQSNSKPSQPSSSTSLSNQNPNPKHKILRSLDHPAILIGTITLPIHDGDRSASNSILRCPSSTCLLFSDESSTICCDVIDIDIRVIGRRKIRVLAWNFIPFNHRGGFLEIIRWSLADSSLGLVPCSHIDSIPLCFNSDTDDECKSRARYRTYGLLDSVSPVSNVPSSMGGYSGGSNTLCGFLGQLRVCECKLCNSLKASGTPLIKECSQHSFSKSVLLYFCGSASSWHPIISKMVGSIVLVSGLKKKLVFIGKELSRTMLVTAEKSMLHIPKLINNFPPKENTTIEGKGELGLFLGVVTGIYMQGMVVELDKEVFLLMTNQLLTQLPGLRVGTLLCMRNVHFVKPRFTWTKLLILGACVKTSITVQCFSPLEAWCNTVPQWQSLLGKFIKSLEFSARLWVLLVISCFRKKFSGILSEKDILGSKHRQGLAHAYASSCLPLSAVRSHHGVFMEFCEHESCVSGNETNYGWLKLVAPVCNFINYCDTTWNRMLAGSGNEFNIYSSNGLSGILCGGRFFNQPTRRILPSKAIGAVLVGSLKISSSSGRLQLTDATGSIDVVIPDLPSTWHFESMIEVNDYDIVLEGMPETVHKLQSSDNEAFSCQKIFQGIRATAELNAAIYVHFYVQKASCRKFFFSPCEVSVGNYKELESGTFHLLLVTHKFPALQKFTGDPALSNWSSMFVEAVILPWWLSLGEKGEAYISTCGFEDQQEESLEHHSNSDCSRCVSYKRCKTIHGQHCTSGFPLDLPCLVSVRGIDHHDKLRSGILHSAKFKAKNNCQPEAQEVMLEFSAENYFKYQFLRIGGYYLVKHHKEDLFCKPMDKDCLKENFCFTSTTHLWSLTFSLGEGLSFGASSHLQSEVGHSNPNNEVFQSELIVQDSAATCSNIFSDITLHVSTDVASLLEVNISRTAVSDCMPSEGNMSTLHGIVVAVHEIDCASPDTHFSTENWKLRSCGEMARRICIHLSMGSGMVRIFGALGKETAPTGFGPGVAATFHRILARRRPDEFRLMPMSFIVINSIKEVNAQCKEGSLSLSFGSHRNIVASQAAFPSCLISDLFQILECKQIQLRSRVVAIHLLVLERNNTRADILQLTVCSRRPAISIPIAAFILDDGSSSCCCWVNGENAETLLRLHLKPPESDFDSTHGTHHPTLFSLDKILKKHGRVIVKSYGSTLDSLHQDLTFSVRSNDLLSSAEENLLKVIILGACLGTFWSITGDVLDSNAVGHLERRLSQMQMTVNTFPNIWARDVCVANTLTDARNLIQELLCN